MLLGQAVTAFENLVEVEEPIQQTPLLILCLKQPF